MKQALRASGANISAKHVEEAFLATLFLLQAAKKAQEELDVVQTTAYTVRDSHADMQKMTTHLEDKALTTMKPGHQSPSIVDLADSGREKMSTGWLQEVLQRTSQEHLHQDLESEVD